MPNRPRNVRRANTNIRDYDTVLLVDERKGEFVRVPITNFEQRTGNNLTQSISDNAIPYWDDGNTEFLDSPLTRNGSDVNQTSGSFNQTGSGIYIESSIEVDTSVNDPQTFLDDRNSGHSARINSNGDIEVLDDRGNVLLDLEANTGGGSLRIGDQAGGDDVLIKTSGNSDFRFRSGDDTSDVNIVAAGISLDGRTTTITSSEINLLNGMTAVSGADTTFISGTAGASGNVAEWDSNGDLIDTGLATSNIVTPSSTDTFTNKTFDANGTGNTLSNVETGDFASSALTGADTQVVTGTSGASGNLVEWNIDGDAVDSAVATSNVMTDLIDDASPQLGGNLDMNGNLIQDANGNELVEFTATTSAVNHFQIVNAATGNGSDLQAVGGDTNIDLLLTPKGSGIISSTADLSLDGGTTTISSSELNLLDGMSSKTGVDTNFVTGTSGTSGNLVEWNIDGDVIDTGIATSNVLTDVVGDTTPQLGGNLDVNGNVLIDTNSNELITFTSNTSAVNEVDVANAATGNTPIVSASGDDTNIDLGLSAQGTGAIDLQSTVSIVDGNNISLGTTNGTQFGTGTSQLLAFYGSSPVTQPSTTGVTTGFTQGTGSTVTDDSTFTGNTGTTAYTIGDLVNHLKTLGLLAS